MRILGVVASSSREVPNAPTIGTATDVGTGRAFNNGAATVTFTAPTFDGGLPITSYTVTSSPGGFTATGAASPLTVTGLQSGTSYTFTVVATNSRGNSTASAASNSITATTVPQAPTIGTATDLGTGTSVSVAFTGNATGGKAVSTYTATSSPSSITGSSASSPITVSGLTAGTAYTFTVTATNANGTSTASAASNSVTPTVPSSFDSIATLTGNGSTTTFTFSSVSQTYKSLQLRIAGNDLFGATPALRFNGLSTNVYAYHSINANGSTISKSGISGVNGLSLVTTSGYTANTMAVYVIDIIDYASTSKNKTVRAISGLPRDSATLLSGLFNSTAAISSITVEFFQPATTGTSIALYGIKG